MNKKGEGELVVIAIVAFVLALIGFAMWLFPIYGVWQQDLAGKANLGQQEWEKKIKIEDAKADMESAKLYAMAEVERAKGVAEANKIIGDSLKGNESYLKYLWIDQLSDERTNKIIYIPTEANMPLLEATRLENEKQS